MRNRTLLVLLVAAVAGCSDSSKFPSEGSNDELDAFFNDHGKRLQNTPEANYVRMYGSYFEKADGQYAEQKGKVIILPGDSADSYHVAYYMPSSEGIYRLVDRPIEVTEVKVPRVGNPLGSSTCLRAPKIDGSGEWYGCIVKGKLVSGTE